MSPGRKQQRNSGDPAVHGLRLRGVQQRARSATPHLSAGQGITRVDGKWVFSAVIGRLEWTRDSKQLATDSCRAGGSYTVNTNSNLNMGCSLAASSTAAAQLNSPRVAPSCLWYHRDTSALPRIAFCPLFPSWRNFILQIWGWKQAGIFVKR